MKNKHLIIIISIIFLLIVGCVWSRHNVRPDNTIVSEPVHDTVPVSNSSANLLQYSDKSGDAKLLCQVSSIGRNICVPYMNGFVSWEYSPNGGVDILYYDSNNSTISVIDHIEKQEECTDSIYLAQIEQGVLVFLQRSINSNSSLYINCLGNEGVKHQIACSENMLINGYSNIAKTTNNLYFSAYSTEENEMVCSLYACSLDTGELSKVIPGTPNIVISIKAADDNNLFLLRKPELQPGINSTQFECVNLDLTTMMEKSVFTISNGDVQGCHYKNSLFYFANDNLSLRRIDLLTGKDEPWQDHLSELSESYDADEYYMENEPWDDKILITICKGTDIHVFAFSVTDKSYWEEVPIDNDMVVGETEKCFVVLRPEPILTIEKVLLLSGEYEDRKVDHLWLSLVSKEDFWKGRQNYIDFVYAD